MTVWFSDCPYAIFNRRAFLFSSYLKYIIFSHCYRIFSLSVTGFSLTLRRCWQYGDFYYCVQLKKYYTVLIQSLVTSLIFFPRYKIYTCVLVTHLENAFVISQRHLHLLDFSPIFAPHALISLLRILCNHPFLCTYLNLPSWLFCYLIPH